jgi:site-specific recombinase XerD
MSNCDPNGRFLPNVSINILVQPHRAMTLTDLVKYALHALRPAMAKFLIQAGADVNSLEKDYGNLLR